MKYPMNILTQFYTGYELMLAHPDITSINIGSGNVMVCDDWDQKMDVPLYNDWTDKEFEGSWFVKLVFESIDDIEVYEE